MKIIWTKYTPFQQKVYKTILKIPKGKVWTYAQVAQKMGNRKWARSVGGALKRNQDAPYIPCHRVVGYNSMGGYSAAGGIKKKLMLLKKEGFRIK